MRERVRRVVDSPPGRMRAEEDCRVGVGET